MEEDHSAVAKQLRFNCDECDKDYTRKFRLKQHKLSKHTEKLATPFTSSIPSNSPLMYKDVREEEESTDSEDMDIEMNTQIYIYVS